MFSRSNNALFRSRLSSVTHVFAKAGSTARFGRSRPPVPEITPNGRDVRNKWSRWSEMDGFGPPKQLVEIVRNSQGSICMQQAAFTTALIMSYSRPFIQSKGWPKLPQELVPYNTTELHIHEQVMQLRHQGYAHSDSSRHKIRP